MSLRNTRNILSYGLPVLFSCVVGFILWQMHNPAVVSSQATAEVTVAFIGDSNDESGFRNVLTLIKNEGADVVMHQGDFSYENGPTDKWTGAINEILGSTFPYYGSDGNHDSWDQYVPFFNQRLQDTGYSDITVNTGNYVVPFQNIDMVFNKEKGDTAFSTQALATSTADWKICSWHHNRHDLQAGGKSNEVDLETYQACIDAGAIVATGHEHSYSRTCPLRSGSGWGPSNNYGANCANPAEIPIGENQSFVFVNGLGGASLRDYEPDHDSDAWWASIYTENRYCANNCTVSGQQDHSNDISTYNYDHGVLFITFNVGGDTSRALGYFKNIAGDLIDEFVLVREGGGTPTTVPTQPQTSSTPVVSLEPTGSSGCGIGDLDCSGRVNALDLTLLLSSFGTNNQEADLDDSGVVNALDVTLLLAQFGG